MLYKFYGINILFSKMSDRRAELERKKAKLQALREEKDRRRREKEMKDVEDAAGRAHAGGDNRKDIDEMLSSLGVAPVSDVLSSLSSMNSITPEHSRNHTPDTSLQLNSLNNTRLVKIKSIFNYGISIVFILNTACQLRKKNLNYV